MDRIDQYLSENDWRVKENSNATYSLQGMYFYLSSEAVKEKWLKIYDEHNKEIAQANKLGTIYLHDLGSLAAYCSGWNMEELIRVGFGGVSCKARSSAPKHVSSLLGQIVNFFYTLQGEMAGAQAFSNFDTLLAPFVKNDNLTYEQLVQAMQEFIFNLNVPTRVGYQTPFTNFTFDITVPTKYAKKYPVIGGKKCSFKYEDCQEEMTMINKAFAEVMSHGDADGRIFSFPIPTFNITKDFNYDIVPNETWEMVAKYGLPYFANYVNSSMNSDDALSMCCRLRIDKKKLVQRGGGLFAANPMTGSIGVVTLNLPLLGYIATGSKMQFKVELLRHINLAVSSLEIKRKVLEEMMERNLYPFAKKELQYTKDSFGSYWHNHFSTVGVIGMNECLLNLLGIDIKSEEGIKFAREIMQLILKELETHQTRTGNFYNLEATPAEGCTYTLAKKNKKDFPQILTAGSDEAPYYTNSIHLPVNSGFDLVETLSHQEKLQQYFTGGTVVHLFLQDRILDPMMVKSLVQKITTQFSVPYFTLTPTFSVCVNHGYHSGEMENCPTCGAPMEVYSRVVGYYRPVSSWNKGKQQEFSDRVIHDLTKEKI